MKRRRSESVGGLRAGKAKWFLNPLICCVMVNIKFVDEFAVGQADGVAVAGAADINADA